MSMNCCATSVPHHGSLKALAKVVVMWQQRLQAGLSWSIQASDQTMGHLEEEILHQTRDLERAVLEEAAQKKAEQARPVCPVCGHKLSRVIQGHKRSYQTRFGVTTIGRLGSGAMESTCKQYQVRFHRSGQFWSQQGDEALRCLETFWRIGELENWRNARWSLLFPHVPRDFDPSKN